MRLMMVLHSQALTMGAEALGRGEEPRETRRAVEYGKSPLRVYSQMRFSVLRLPNDRLCRSFGTSSRVFTLFYFILKNEYLGGFCPHKPFVSKVLKGYRETFSKVSLTNARGGAQTNDPDKL